MKNIYKAFIFTGIITLIISCPVETPIVGNIANMDKTNMTTVNVMTYGADPTGVKDSALAFKIAMREVKRLNDTQSLPVRVIFEPGTYQIYPEHAEQKELYMSNTVGADKDYSQKRIGILLEGVDDVVVDGQGAKLEFHGQQTAFSALRSRNIVFENFSFDYVSPRVIDAMVADTGVTNGLAFRELQLPSDTNYSINGTTITWSGEIAPETGYPYWTGTNGMNYTQTHSPAENKTWRSGNPLFVGVTAITDLGNKRIRIDYNSGALPTDKGYIYQMRQDKRDTAAAFFFESADITIRKIDAHYLHGFGYLMQMSSNLTIEDSTFLPDSKKDRYTVGFADIFQASGNSGTIILRRNTWGIAHDDPINIHGTYIQIIGRGTPPERTLILGYQHPQSSGFPQFYPGNEIEIVNKQTMAAEQLPAVPKVVSVRGPSGFDRFTPNLNTMEITLDVDIPLTVTNNNYVVENITYTPSVLIENSIFPNNPTRGILVTTRRPVIIQDNTFDGFGMPSIFISSDAYQWYESGPTLDVLIQRNRFTRQGGNSVIFIEPTNQVMSIIAPVHRNIRVINNEFFVSNNVAAIDSKSVDGLIIEGNKIMREDRNTALTISIQNHNLSIGDTAQITLKKGSNYNRSIYKLRANANVTIKGNKYDPGIDVWIELINGTTQASVTIQNDVASFTAGNIILWPPEIYSSSAPNIATVTPTGEVKAISVGQTKITAIVQAETGDIVSNPLTITVQ